MRAAELSETKLPKLESGGLGENWTERPIALLLLCEAKGAVELVISNHPHTDRLSPADYA
jgi:hypothetical protein